MMPRTTNFPSDLTDTQARIFGANRDFESYASVGVAACWLADRLLRIARSTADPSGLEGMNARMQPAGATEMTLPVPRLPAWRLHPKSATERSKPSSAVSLDLCGCQLLFAITLMFLIGLPATGGADRNHYQDEHRHDGKAGALRPAVGMK